MVGGLADGRRSIRRYRDVAELLYDRLHPLQVIVHHLVGEAVAVHGEVKVKGFAVGKGRGEEEQEEEDDEARGHVDKAPRLAVAGAPRPPPSLSLTGERASGVKELVRPVVQALDDPPRARGLLVFRARTATRRV